MIRSMTGYGRAQAQLNGRDITVEMKSVNHRYFEFSARVPRSCGYLEEPLKKCVGARVSRGKVEAAVTIATVEGAPCEVQVDARMAKGYADALRSLSGPLALRDDITLAVMARFSDIFLVRKTPEDEQAVIRDVLDTAAMALSPFVAMREREGANLREDMLRRLDVLAAHVGTVEARSPRTVAEYRERLYRKLSEILGDRGIDDARVLLEAGIFADRVAVDEETVRLRSHIAQFRQIIDSPEPVGRKLDFLVQELNREANTIGSKAQDASLACVVVEMKSEIEKIREQIQNIE